KRALDIMHRTKVLEGNRELIRLLKRSNEGKRILQSEKMTSRLGLIAPMIEKQMIDIYYHEADESIPKRERYIKLIELDLGLYTKVGKACSNMKYLMENILEEILLELDHEEYV
ncbi:MAG TPA: hypothetical protein PLQ76_05390, partial [bacterium]|nr:hypothetical protein [bacterium]